MRADAELLAWQTHRTMWTAGSVLSQNEPPSPEQADALALYERMRDRAASLLLFEWLRYGALDAAENYLQVQSAFAVVDELGSPFGEWPADQLRGIALRLRKSKLIARA